MIDSIFYTADRAEWRAWLEEHFETEEEIWFVFPMKESGEASLSYNDAVEEALCFGWIDSTIRHIDALHRAQHFTPRKPGSPYNTWQGKYTPRGKDGKREQHIVYAKSEEECERKLKEMIEKLKSNEITIA